MIADLEFDRRGPAVVAHLAGELDLSNANEVGAALVRGMPKDADGLVLDFTALRYLDSAGINLVYELCERFRARGQHLRLLVPPGSHVLVALEVAGVSATIGIVASVEEGFESMGLDGNI
jgi:anti-sigma B factor antagonist